MKNEAVGLKRTFTAYEFSMKGLKSCYRSEAAFRQEVWLSLVLTPLALILGESSVEKVLLITVVFFCINCRGS